MESRTQGSRPRPRPRTQKNSRPRTGILEAKVKNQEHRRKCSPKKEKKVLKNFFQTKKRSSKRFFRLSLEKEYKKGLRKFSARFLAFSKKISSVQKIVLSLSRWQGNFRGPKASRPRPRTLKCVLEDVFEAKDVFENYLWRKMLINCTGYPWNCIAITPHEWQYVNRFMIH